MAHEYSKFKNKNIPYAKVGRRVFNSLFDAETFCTEHGLDVNSAIEYRDDPKLKINIQTIAQYQKAILQECLDRLKAHAEALVQEINRCNADLEKCHPLDRGFLTDRRNEAIANTVTASGMNFPVMNVFTDRTAPMICFTRQIVRRMQNNENYQA